MNVHATALRLAYHVVQLVPHFVGAASHTDLGHGQDEYFAPMAKGQVPAAS